MPCAAGFGRFISHRVVVALLLFESVVVLNGVTGRYLSASDLLQPSNTAAILLRCLPMMMCGYTLAKFPKYERVFLLTVGLVYFLFAVPDAIGFRSISGTALGRTKMAAEHFGLDSADAANSYVHTFIYFSPLLIYFSATLIRLYGVAGKRMRLAILAAQATFCFVAVFSGFTAPLLLVLAFFALAALCAPVRTSFTRALWIGLGLVGIVVLDVLRGGFAGDAQRGAVARAFQKLSVAVESLFSGGLESGIDEASSGRWSLLFRSLGTFIRNPLFGHGLDTKSDIAIGGHSFLADTAAIFGLIGFLPIVYALGVLLFGLFRSRWWRNYDWRAASSLIVISLIWIGNVINPYLLNMLSLSLFEFLALGFCLADLERVIHDRHQAMLAGAGWRHPSIEPPGRLALAYARPRHSPLA